MKTANYIIVLVLFLSGCSTTSPFEQSLSHYRDIVPGMTEQEVISQLGAPDMRPDKQTAIWRSDELGNSVELRVVFGPDRVVVNTSKSARSHNSSSSSLGNLRDPL